MKPITISKLKQIIQEELSATLFGQWTSGGLQAAIDRGDKPRRPNDISDYMWEESISRCLNGESEYCPMNHGVIRRSEVPAERRPRRGIEPTPKPKRRVYTEDDEVYPDITDHILGNIWFHATRRHQGYPLVRQLSPDGYVAYAPLWRRRPSKFTRWVERMVRADLGHPDLLEIFGTDIGSGSGEGASETGNDRQKLAYYLIIWNKLAWWARSNGYRRLIKYPSWEARFARELKHHYRAGSEETKAWEKATKRGSWRPKTNY